MKSKETCAYIPIRKPILERTFNGKSKKYAPKKPSYQFKDTVKPFFNYFEDYSYEEIADLISKIMPRLDMQYNAVQVYIKSKYNRKDTLEYKICFQIGNVDSQFIEINIIQKIQKVLSNDEAFVANGFRFYKYIFTDYEDMLRSLVSSIKEVCRLKNIENNLNLVKHCQGCSKYIYIEEGKSFCEFCEPDNDSRISYK